MFGCVNLTVTHSYVQDLEMKVQQLQAQLISARSTSQPHTFNRESIVVRTTTSPTSFNARSLPTPSSNPTNGDDPSDSTVEAEIADVNRHTNAVEYHGSTSSMAFLGDLRRRRSSQQKEGLEDTASLVSALHNPAFNPQIQSTAVQKSLQSKHNFYFKQAHVFIDAYFDNLHFIHPLVDKEDFLARSNDLWFGRASPDDTSFRALYLSLMSLGALVKTWDEERLDGLTRFEWSRKLFLEAQSYLNETKFTNDLDTVQALYFMAKVCQNELNPHMAYMYLGLAVRTCLSAGFNRESPNPKYQRSMTISKTWWGIFSLEIEMSFSLGRPDTLGMDAYHNRRLPEIDDSEYAIIPLMVDFAQIIRRVSVIIYHTRSTWQEKMMQASQIERELEAWVTRLPEKIKPFSPGERLGGSLKEPKWCRRQRLVLNIRKHRSFSTRIASLSLLQAIITFECYSLDPSFPILRSRQHLPSTLFEIRWTNVSNLQEGQSRSSMRCIGSTASSGLGMSAGATSDRSIVANSFRWYNTTYVMFAASSLLLYVTRVLTPTQCPSAVRSIEMAVEILEAMDDSIVARKSAEIVKQTLKEARGTTIDSVIAPSHPHSGVQTPIAQTFGNGFMDVVSCKFSKAPHMFERGTNI